MKYKYTAGNTHFSNGRLEPLNQTFLMGSSKSGKGCDAVIHVDAAANITKKVFFPSPVKVYDFVDSVICTYFLNERNMVYLG